MVQLIALTLAIVEQAKFAPGDGANWVRGRNCHPPKLIRLLPLIAHWPAMARWNRDDESIYKLKQLMKTYVIERSWDLF